MKKPKVVTYKHEWRTMTIDERVGTKRARKFLDDKAPNLSYPMKGQEPCVFEEGEVIVIDPHYLWVTISRIKPAAGQWKITYLLSDHRPAFLGKKTGYTSNPGKALKAHYTTPDDERHDELEAIPMTEIRPEKDRQEALRRRENISIEALVMEREAQQKRLLTTKSEISKRLLPRMIEKLNKQIAVLEAEKLGNAA